MNKFGAFSLVELLIVMAIIGIIAAIAVPAYSQYTTRAKLGKTITFMKTIADVAMVNYTKGQPFPARMTFNNTIFGGGSPAWVYFNIPLGNNSEIVALNYNPSPDGRGFIIQATTNATSTVPNFIAPGDGYAGNVGAYAMITYAVRDIDGVLTVFCGDFRDYNSTESIPVGFLPTGCRCQNGLTWYTTGTAPCVQG